MHCLFCVNTVKHRYQTFGLAAALTLFFSTFAIPPQSVPAANINAASPALNDVLTAIALAANGDTVVVPAGTASWTSALDITKAITIQGATTVTGTRDNPTVTDATIIQDNIPRSNQLTAIIRATIPLGGTFRLTGFTFKAGSITQIADNGGVRLGGFSQAMRLDHCHFNQIYQNPNVSTSAESCVYGVVDHCVFDVGSNQSESFSIQHDAWGGSGVYGDGSWADDSYFGTNKFLFIEDCTFNRIGNGGGLDCYSGGRYVARYNRFNNMGTQAHGTETTRRHRSARAIEVYNNTFNWTWDSPHMGELRGGTLLYYNNSFIGSLRVEKGVSLACYRQYYPFWVWGGASGSNPFDKNDPTLYLSGTAASGSGQNTLVVSGANWTPNQWVGYTVTNLTQTLNSGSGQGWHGSSWIESNTGNTIYVKSDGNVDGPNVSFAAGDQFEIRKVLIALDQPGRGKGTMITGDTPTNPSWPNQALDPVYAWNNKRTDNSDVLIWSAEPTMQEGRDFYSNTPKPGYTPYTYPHPLTVLAPPTNLQIVAGP
jgi:hypothetical protein